MNKQLLIAALLLNATLANLHQNSLVDHGGKIISGSPIDISLVPYQVQILHSQMCGGSILSKDYVITAGHCTLDVPADTITVRSGTSVFDQGGVASRVLENHVHPNYILSSTNDYDVAILKVEPLSLSRANNMLPIGLPPSGTTWPSSTPASVVGWGRTEYGTPSNILLQAVVRIYDRSVCAHLFSLAETMLCVNHPQSTQNVCNGDSGGGLVPLNSNILAGIVSFGVSECGHPGLTTPVVFMNVAHPEIRQFINEKTGL